MGVLEGQILKSLDQYICLGVPVMGHCRIFVHTSCPDQTQPHPNEQLRSNILFAFRNSSEGFWVFFHWGKKKKNVIYQPWGGKKA